MLEQATCQFFFRNIVEDQVYRLFLMTSLVTVSESRMAAATGIEPSVCVRDGEDLLRQFSQKSPGRVLICEAFEGFAPAFDVCSIKKIKF